MKQPLVSLSQESLLGGSKGPSGARNDQKLERPVPKVSSFEIFFQDFLSTGSRDTNDDEKKRPLFFSARNCFWGGGSKGPKWAQNDQKVGTMVITDILSRFFFLQGLEILPMMK